MVSFIGSILLMLLFAALFILFFGISLLAKLFGGIRNVWNIFTGGGATASRSSNYSSNHYSRNYRSDGAYADGGNKSTRSADQGHRPHSSGVFKDDEGTYVDFEEVKS